MKKLIKNVKISMLTKNGVMCTPVCHGPMCMCGPNHEGDSVGETRQKYPLYNVYM
ncbi:hypothetical protein PV797_04710 [Clostridiaceae bacterium M8S5]|nr:hypothetical protein PV797_04710 [Clostridiaceae bacterium M8S5]